MKLKTKYVAAEDDSMFAGITEEIIQELETNMLELYPFMAVDQDSYVHTFLDMCKNHK